MDSNAHFISIPDEAMAVGAKRPAKLRRSCEPCRKLKAKCVASEQSSKRCQRCTKEGTECIFLEPKVRLKRAKNSSIRVTEMEEKLEELMALVTSKQTTQAPVTSLPDSASGTPQPTTSFNLPDANSDAFMYPFALPVNPPRSESMQLPFPMFPFLNFDDPFQDVISKGLVQFSQAEESVRKFQKIASNFPFVILPPQVTVDTLRREKPFLLLVVLAWGSASETKLQDRLELEVRETLSKKAIVNGEKSLDLLQGLLVYLAWYHFYFHVEREQLYQLLQLAAAMAIDLEINVPARDFRQCDDELLGSKPQPIPQTSSEELESQRTFLGTYFLTSSHCQGLRKPNSLHYDDYMETCGQSLSLAAQAESDYLVPYFIRLQRLAEEIDLAFEYSRPPKVPQSNAARIEILVKAFERQISHIQESFPSFIWKNNSITMRFHHLRSYLHRVGFHANKPSELELASSTATLRSWYYSASRSECLIRCLQATKDYLDRYLLLAPEDIINFTFPDFILVVYAILLLGAFGAEVDDSQTLDITHMMQAANLDHYRDELSDQALRAHSLLPQGGNKYMQLFHLIFQKSKLCNMNARIVSLPGAERTRSVLKSIMPQMKSDGVFTADMPNNSNEEQWTETLSRWATIPSQDLSFINIELDNYLP